MPGSITRLWGSPARDGARELELDLLEPWPLEREDSFVVASSGTLAQPWLKLALLGTLGLAAILWARRLRA